MTNNVIVTTQSDNTDTDTELQIFIDTLAA